MKSDDPEGGKPAGETVATERSASDLFSMLWEVLADVLGTAAVATLLKRAARRSAIHNPELAGLTFRRDGLRYEYTLPPDWNSKSEAIRPALRDLITELRPILVELTGQVVVRHLEQFPELRELFALDEGNR